MTTGKNDVEMGEASSLRCRGRRPVWGADGHTIGAGYIPRIRSDGQKRTSRRARTARPDCLLCGSAAKRPHS